MDATTPHPDPDGPVDPGDMAPPPPGRVPLASLTLAVALVSAGLLATMPV